jgi:hypothetical protein
MRTARIYRPAYDCTNGGVTSRVNTVRVFEENEEIPEKVTVNDFYEENRSNLTGGPREEGEAVHWALIPLVRLDAAVDGAARGLLGPFFGGNLAVAAYDGKPERIYHVHDRFETPEEYRALST